MSSVTLDLSGDAKDVVDSFGKAADAVGELNDETKEFDKSSKKAFGDATKASDAFGKSVDDTTKSQKKELGILEKIDKDLKALKKARLEANDVSGIKKLNKEIDAQEKKMNKLTGTTKKVGLSFKDIAKGALAFTGISAGIELIKGAFTRVISVVGDYDQATSQLKAITGLDAEQFIPFNKAIKDVARNSSKSAVDVAKAFQLIGSAQPELLKSADALAEVTEASILLAKAGGLDVPVAANALTKAMNQYGAASSDAAKFTDIFATSQQKGTATIAQLADSLTNVGAVANAAGISFEDTNVALQALAKGGLVGAEAGTALRGVYSKLANQSRDELNPTLTSQADIIETLSKENIGLKEATDLVGESSAKALLTLIAQKDTVNNLTGALNEQGNASRQAATATDNIKDKYSDLQGNIDNLIISIEDGSGGFGRFAKAGLDIINGLFPLMEDGFNFIGDLFGDVGEALGELGAAFGFVNEEGESTIGITDVIGKSFEAMAIPMKTAINVIVSVIKGLSLLIETGKQVFAFFSGEGFDTKAVEDAANSFGDSILKIGDDAINGTKRLINGVEDLQKKSVDELRKLAEQAVANRDSALIKDIKNEVERRKNAEKEKQDILIEAANEEAAIVIEGAQELTDAQKKAAEKRAKELLAIEKKYQDDLAKLALDAENAQIDKLEGEARFKAIEAQRNKEIDLIKQSLEAQRIELGLGAELEQEQLDQLQILRDQAHSEQLQSTEKFNQDKIKQDEDFANKELDLQEEILIERAKQIEDDSLTVEELEIQKQIAILDIQKDYAQKRIDALGETLTKEDELLKLQLENQIADIDDQANELNNVTTKFSLAKLLGVTDEEFEDIKQSMSIIANSVLQATNDMFAAQQQANEDLIAGIDERIEETEDALEREFEAQEAGQAANVEGKQKELEALKLQKEKAQKDAEALAKKQFLLDTAVQASSIITASANILKGFSTIPITGQILGIAAVTAMIGSFVLAKTQAFNAISAGNSSQAATGASGKGSTGTVHGRRHSQGGENFTDHLEVETGEDWAILSRGASEKHGDKFHAFAEGLNSGIHPDDMLRDLLEGTGVTIDKKVPQKIEAKKTIVAKKQAQSNANMISDKMVEILSSVDGNLDEFLNFTKNKKQIIPTEWGRIEIENGKQTKIRDKG